MKRANWFLVGLLLLAGVSHVATASDIAQLVATLQADIPNLMHEHHVPGLSMVLIRDGRIAWTGCFGVRVAGKSARVDPDTVFEAASMSKPLFSYAVLKLVERGMFDLDRPLDSYLVDPYLPTEPRAAKITGRMVLLHRTGLPNWRRGKPLVVEREPDTCFTYSGEGYVYLQTAIAQITGQDTTKWMQDTLLTPLEMTRSSYQWQPIFESNHAGGHDQQGQFKTDRRFYQTGNAAYSLYTTPTDYAKFLIEMMKPDRSATHSLNAHWIRGMTTLQAPEEEAKPRSRRGLGWVVDSAEDGGFVTHSGSNGTGFRCNSRFHIKSQSGSVIMTNSTGGRAVWEAILKIIDSDSSNQQEASIAPAANPIDVTPSHSTSTATSQAGASAGPADPETASAGEHDKLAPPTASDQGPFTTWDPTPRTIHYEYRLLNATSDPATKLRVNVPLPQSTPRQQIQYLHLPENLTCEMVTDQHGQRLVQYTLDRLEPGEWIDLGYVVGITLQNMQWNYSPTSSPYEPAVLTPQARALYLKPETDYSMDSRLMRRTAASLTRDVSTDFDKLARIHDHIIDSIRYVRDDVWDPAATVLARGSGSCSEYNYVLSGLCRLAGLPTRCVGGSTSSLRELPTTDVVYHRWTEVFLSDYGWFPVDCSRDANPIRGKRSHFGRVYVDALVWCRQAGGDDDSLGWDYRAKAHIDGDDPGVRELHRTRWFRQYPEKDIEAAYEWLLRGNAGPPHPDLLECALLRWNDASPEARLRIIRELARAGRNTCLRRVATLPIANNLRSDLIEELSANEALATTLKKRSRNLSRFRDWFNQNEANLVSDGHGRFNLVSNESRKKISTTTKSAQQIWLDLVPSAVEDSSTTVPVNQDTRLAVMPIVDQTLAGMSHQSEAIHAALKEGIAQQTRARLVDDRDFDRWMSESGPGPGEYWMLANRLSEFHSIPQCPDVVAVPVCISTQEENTVLYHLELKCLKLQGSQYTKVVSQKRRRARKSGPRDEVVLVAGGDTVLARWEHDLVDRNGYDWPLFELRQVLTAADAALCNLECCVSLKGLPTDKGERCSFFYRARPEMLRCLTDAGIDIVTAANNHGGDYGPESVLDTARWCHAAGLVCVGNGRNPTEARAPRLVRIGSLQVAVVGMDTTMPFFAATESRPGTNYVDVDESLKMFTSQLQQLGQWARGRCDLVVLTIHWGRNWALETPDLHRRMARIAFDHGVDLILGHSAHRLQGIEVIDGKAVIYDMGNLLFDCDLQPAGKQCGLFQVRFTRRGVHRIEFLPTEVLEGHTVFAHGQAAKHTLSEMQELCQRLRTDFSIEEDLAGRPIGVVSIDTPHVTARSQPEQDLTIQTFPSDNDLTTPSLDNAFLVDHVPPHASIPASPCEFGQGVQLCGYCLPKTAPKDGILTLVTWWRVTGEVPPHVLPAFHICSAGETLRRGTPWYTRHDAADWTLPFSRVAPGTLVKDSYPARLAGLPPGPSKVYAVLLDTTRIGDQQMIAEPYLLGEVQIQPREDGPVSTRDSRR